MDSSRRNNLSPHEPRMRAHSPNLPDENRLRKSATTPMLTSRSFQSHSEAPEAKSPYNSLTNGVRKMLSHELACKLGCKGKKCKYDSSDWEKQDMEIEGLFSNWITDDILAMARPRKALIDNSKLIHRFKKAGIRSIFNLQTRYEHKDCGDGILPDTGFSYDPTDFTQNDIYYYNYELEDFSVGSTEKILDMVKVLDFALTEGKAAVHCHAGLGRTGLLISCYLIYSLRMNANQAIHFVREKRKNSVQMTEQIQAVKDFEKFLIPLRVVYYIPIDRLVNSLNLEANDTQKNSTSFSLHTFLLRQKLLLHGAEQKQLRYIPKIIVICGEQIKKLILKWKNDGIVPRHLKEIQRYSDELDEALAGAGRSRSKKPNPTDPLIYIAEALSTINFTRKIMKKVEYYQAFVNENNEAYDELLAEEDPFILSALIWSWLDHLKEPVLRDQEINILLKGYSNKSSNFDIINWKDLDKGTLYTVNYLIGILHELLPLEESLKNDLVNQLIACLTQTKLRNDERNNYDENNNFDSQISLLSSTKKNEPKYDYAEEALDEQQRYNNNHNHNKDDYRSRQRGYKRSDEDDD